MAKSSIEWTEMTWNPTTGCDKISTGCKFCYALSFSKRLHGMGVSKYKNGFKLTLHPDTLDAPRKWREPKIIFVNSMSDLFHKNIPFEYLKKVFDVMNECPQHIFQVLTKRSDILLKFSPELNWTENIWMGVSVENEKVKFRIDDLVKSDAKIKFLSLEPLLGPLPKLKLNKIDWVIVGGESGPRARPMKKEWVDDIKYQCQMNEVPFFFKQWGGRNKKEAGRELDGRTYNEMPQYSQAI
ncbi:MAG: phage Gp37/Gp68 family protein [Chlorobi bacterium]|nr:phage Gp37/Gp68 family protein [Chlorobiota bacterium]MCI0716144.1 phage Gp37/Gp68 family protein [Chlorobiota bacterium]